METLNKQSIMTLLQSVLSEVKGIDAEDLTKAEQNIKDKIENALENINEYKS